MKGKGCLTPTCKGCDFNGGTSHRCKLRSLSKKQESAYEESLGEVSAFQKDESHIEESLAQVSGFQEESLGEVSAFQNSVEENLGEISGFQETEENENGNRGNACGHEEIPVSKSLGANMYDPLRSNAFGQFLTKFTKLILSFFVKLFFNIFFCKIIPLNNFSHAVKSPQIS